jgi:hypothetical protein
MGLWVPPGTAPIVYDCIFCGGQHDEKGLGRCARDNPEKVEQARLATKMPFLGDEHNDVELERYMKKVGARMLKERRLEMKPNERVKDN